MTNIIKLKSEFRIQQDTVKESEQNLKENKEKEIYESYLECVKQKSETECEKIFDSKKSLFKLF